MNLLLRLGDSDLALTEGDYIIGRAPECDIVLDDRLASRTHAKLTCTPDRWVVQDLASSNGTFVNGTPVAGARQLAPGDVIVVGRSELTVHARGVPGESKRRRIPTRDDQLALRRRSEAVPTTQKDVLDLLAGVAQRAIDHGNPTQAEKVLGPLLMQILDANRRGPAPALDLVTAACRHALMLAEATSRGTWANYVVESYWHLAIAIPLPLINRLAPLWRELKDLDTEMLHAYVERMRASSTASSAEVSDTIERLERMASRA